MNSLEQSIESELTLPQPMAVADRVTQVATGSVGLSIEDVF